MDEKSPETISVATHLFMIALAAWGGLTSYLSRVRSGKREPFSAAELIGEMATSGFAGLLSFWACEGSGVAPLYTAVIVGISGHMGGRALFLLEDIIKRRFGVARD
jgi:hypothetical protein